ncbi:DJ-1/PfpI family protein [Thermoactinospora rubra]|uniref:DJ-1/PfpI family protein n=1 Tax=Thermoactinospora rubra TaxID=1088767 RepID=UPI000A1082E5|nr:DJ-1/PfpI family protein [Thermoactinospora rubra]
MTANTIALVAYPGLTPLDLVGPLQVMATLAKFDPSWKVAVVGEDALPVATDTPLHLSPSHSFDQIAAPHTILVPGGEAPAFAAMANERLLAWLREAAAQAQVIASVCTGSLVLGAAGLLQGRKATTHWAAHHLLPRFGATPVFSRWVEDGRLITSAGVSAGIDMALHLVDRWAGAEMAELVQRFIEYDPQPPRGPLQWEGFDRAAYQPAIDGLAREGLAGHPALLARLLD